MVVVTATVVIANVAVEVPAGTVTEAGTVALPLLDVSATLVLLPAGPLRVMVPVAGFPPRRDVGDTVTLTKVAGVIVNVALRVVLP